MIELEVYAAGVRDLNKILELDEPTTIFRETRGILVRPGVEPRFAVHVLPGRARAPKRRCCLPDLARAVLRAQD